MPSIRGRGDNTGTTTTSRSAIAPTIKKESAPKKPSKKPKK